MELENYLKQIEQFLIDYLKQSHCQSYILGLSGGIDSTLVAAIAKKAVGKNKLFCYFMPISSNPLDQVDALQVAKELDLNLQIVDLNKTYDSFVDTLNAKEFTPLTLSNLKVRLRMCTLFAFAQEHKGLVLGTDNMDEYYVGYFTKYGDGGVDLLPIVSLTKEEVRLAAKHYGLSEKLVNRIPTAGLFEGQTDEKEMGILYKDLDAYLLGKDIDEKIKQRIEYLHKISEHKRNPIPRPAPFKRN